MTDNYIQAKIGPLMRRWGLILVVSGVACFFYSMWIDKARLNKPTDGVPIGGIYQ